MSPVRLKEKSVCSREQNVAMFETHSERTLSVWHCSIHKSMDGKVKIAELYELAKHRKYGKIVHAKDLPLI